jgi:hypothetical protein
MEPLIEKLDSDLIAFDILGQAIYWTDIIYIEFIILLIVFAWMGSIWGRGR